MAGILTEQQFCDSVLVSPKTLRVLINQGLVSPACSGCGQYFFTSEQVISLGNELERMVSRRVLRDNLLLKQRGRGVA